jgi:putative permease
MPHGVPYHAGDLSASTTARVERLRIYRDLARAIFLATGLVVLLWFFYQIEQVLMASLLALILAIALNAPVTWLERRNVSRGLATLLSFAGVLVLLGGVSWLVVPRLAEEIPTLIDEVPALVESLVQQVGAVTGDHPEVQRQLSRVVDLAFNAFEEMWRHSGRLAGAAVLGLFIIALVLYMVVNLRPMLSWYIRSMPERHREAATRAFARSSRMVIGWVIASVILGAIKSVAAGIFLTLMAVPGAIVWAAIAFLGAFIPRVGFYLMTLPPVVIAFTVDPMTAVWTLIFYVVFSEILGNFVAPLIYEGTMQINAVLILIMMLAMGYAFGLVGVFIAAPVAGFVKAYYDEFYLKRQSDDPDLAERVRRMMERREA